MFAVGVILLTLGSGMFFSGLRGFATEFDYGPYILRWAVGMLIWILGLFILVERITS